MENARFQDLLKEHIELKGLTNKKLSEMTGIPERYVEALLTGRNNLLPPAPYVRGYVNRLSSVLDFDQNTMWQLYQAEAHVPQSGQSDRLPSNRFAVKTIDKKWLIAGLVGLFLIFYLGSNIYQMFKAPRLLITNPQDENIVWGSPTINLQGKVESINTLTINGVEVYVDRDSRFEEEYVLQPGLNTIEFIAKKFLGRQTKVIRQVIYQLPQNEQVQESQSKPE